MSLGGRVFDLPIIPANMSTIVDERTCMFLASRNLFYVMHRFDVDAVEFTKRMQEKGLFASVSLGIKLADYHTVNRFVEEGVEPEYITVDVAHGDSQEVFKMVRYIKENLPETYVIGGNVATVDGAMRLEEAGVDAVKVGVGPGSVCLTAPNTGFGSRGWQLSSVFYIAEALADSDVEIIADGGIRNYGDIAKSLAFGANMVMIGGMFAAHDESPGEFVNVDGENYKEFFGSASEFQKGESKHVEGKRELIPHKGALDDTLNTIKENLQSSVSYAGGNTLESLRNVEFAVVKR